MREQIDRLIEAGKLSAVAALLDGADMPSIRYAAQSVEAAIRERDGDLLKHIKQLVNHPAVTSHQLACQLLPYAYAIDRQEAIAHIPLLVESDDWTLRDAACEVSGRLLREDFSHVIGEIEGWRSGGSENLLRAVLVAAIRASDHMHLERAEPLLRLLEPLLRESAPLVRRNLGPSALGMHLLQEYPIQTFEYLVNWSTSNDAQTLWNVAMAFSTPAAAPIAKKALIVLRKLSLDERRLVWRAVASAMWKLGRRRPDVIRPELSRWLEDERRVDVAREAVRHL